MFTGLIEEIGTITRVTAVGEGAHVLIETTPEFMHGVQHGDSICVSGICLTVIAQTATSFTAEVMRHTIAATATGTFVEGARVNLEHALQAQARLGGHIVQGHIDGVGEVLHIREDGPWRILRISLTHSLAPFLARRGSIAVNGVSLTISSISDAQETQQWFEVSLISETLEATTLSSLCEKDSVNLETDIIARHIERFLAFG